MFKHSYHLVLQRTTVSKHSLVQRKSETRITEFHPNISNCIALDKSLDCSGSNGFLISKMSAFTRTPLLAKPALRYYNL